MRKDLSEWVYKPAQTYIQIVNGMTKCMTVHAAPYHLF